MDEDDDADADIGSVDGGADKKMTKDDNESCA
jgi:hypothetical protein